MGGETEANESGWSIDTLHQHMQRQLDAHAEGARRELDLIQGGLRQQMDDARVLLDERYNTSVKALDAAFASQQVAMRTALEAAEKAVQVAMVSAEKAVTKAEVAAEKRFEAVNEFRAQLADQAASFPTRIEVDTRHTALVDKVDAAAIAMHEKIDSRTGNSMRAIQELTARLDKRDGAGEGRSAMKDDGRQVMVIAISFIAIVVTILIYLATKGG